MSRPQSIERIVGVFQQPPQRNEIKGGLWKGVVRQETRVYLEREIPAKALCQRGVHVEPYRLVALVAEDL
jgi:hypothetical protein